MGNTIILENKIQCVKCKEIIESIHTHDFKLCSCGACAVDGGKDYLRRCGVSGDFIDLSICEEADKINTDDVLRKKTSIEKLEKIIMALENVTLPDKKEQFDAMSEAYVRKLEKIKNK